MGTWGTAISSNDIYADIYNSFFEMYNDGLEVDEISNKLISENQELIKDPSDSDDFWFAIAKAQWECKALNQKVLNQVKKSIENGSNLQIWKDKDASSTDLKKRETNLNKFLEKIQIKKSKAKPRKNKKILQPIFEKGDCLAFKFPNGKYGGAIVLEAIKNTEYGHNLIALTRLNQIDKPTINDFKKSEILFYDFGNWKNEIGIMWYYPIHHSKMESTPEVLFNIPIKIKYDIDSKSNDFTMMSNFDIWVVEIAFDQFSFEESSPKPSRQQKTKEFISKNKWKFWL